MRVDYQKLSSHKPFASLASSGNATTLCCCPAFFEAMANGALSWQTGGKTAGIQHESAQAKLKRERRFDNAGLFCLTMPSSSRSRLCNNKRIQIMRIAVHKDLVAFSCTVLLGLLVRILWGPMGMLLRGMSCRLGRPRHRGNCCPRPAHTKW